jgi:hypothetical protein
VDAPKYDFEMSVNGQSCSSLGLKCAFQLGGAFLGVVGGVDRGQQFWGFDPYHRTRIGEGRGIQVYPRILSSSQVGLFVRWLMQKN